MVVKQERELTLSLYALRVGLHHLFKAKGELLAKVITDAIEKVLLSTEVPFTPKETSPWVKPDEPDGPDEQSSQNEAISEAISSAMKKVVETNPPPPLSALFDMDGQKIKKTKESDRKKKRKEKEDGPSHIVRSLLKDMERIVRRAGPGGISQLKIGTLFPMRAKHRQEIMECLVASGVLYPFHGKKKGTDVPSLGRTPRYYIHKDYVGKDSIQ